MTATAFVLGATGKPANEIIALARKAGISLSARYVHVIRTEAKAKANARMGATSRKSGARNGSAEATMRRAIAELGLVHARRILERVESEFRT